MYNCTTIIIIPGMFTSFNWSFKKPLEIRSDRPNLVAPKAQAEVALANLVRLLSSFQVKLTKRSWQSQLAFFQLSQVRFHSFIHSFIHFLHLFPSLEGPLASLFANAAAAAHAWHLDSRTQFFGCFNEVLESFLCAKNWGQHSAGNDAGREKLQEVRFFHLLGSLKHVVRRRRKVKRARRFGWFAVEVLDWDGSGSSHIHVFGVPQWNADLSGKGKASRWWPFSRVFSCIFLPSCWRWFWPTLIL